MGDRVNRLIECAGIAEDSCVLIHKPSNMFYLSGFTGEGLIVISRTMRAIVTDFRYTEQAQAQAPVFSIHAISNDLDHAQVVAGLLRQEQIKTALYEDDYLTVRAKARLEDAFGVIRFEPLQNAPEKLRQIKDPEEIALIEKACAISDHAFKLVCSKIGPGMSEIGIKRMLDNQMLELGADGTAFDTIVASGANGSLPHAIAGERKVQKGDMITLDFGAKYRGYCADMTRTIAIGQADSRMLEIFDIVLRTQMECQDALAPGKTCRDVDAIARKRIGDAGYRDRFGHGLGHALGIDIHEDPRLNPKCTEILRPGHVITVEPGIYIPGLGGVRIENTCLITEEGARPLVHSPRELHVL